MIIAGASSGAVDYSTFEPTRQWFTHENLRLTAFENERRAKAWELRLVYRSSSRGDEDCQEAVNEALYNLLPWAMDKDGDLSGDQDRIYSMIADWYRFFGDDDELQGMMGRG